MSHGRAVAVFSVAAAGGVALCARIASGPLILDAGWGYLPELILGAALWAVAVVAILRIPSRLALPLVFLAGVAIRVAALAGPPVTSDDLYRYAWDGRAQAAGINPYAHVPASDEMIPIRERWLWPVDAECAAIHRAPGCTRLNRAPSATIYPPAAQAWFHAVYRTGGGVEHQHKPWQVAGLLTEIGVLVLLPVALRRFGRDPRWTALYALGPAPALEIVHNGHVDGLAILLVVGALVVAGGQWRHRDIVAGVLIGLAALVKLFPVVLVLALAGLLGRPRFRTLLRASIPATAVIALGYLPHIAAVGWKVLGYAPGYLQEERYADGGRFLLAGTVGLTGPSATVVTMLALAAVAGWVLWRRHPVPAGGALILGALLLATSPVQPWYSVMLLAVATVAVQPRWSVLVVVAYPYYFAVVLDSPAAVTIGRLGYVAALLVIAVVTLRGVRRTSSPDADEGGPIDRAHPPARGAVPAGPVGLQ